MYWWIRLFVRIIVFVTILAFLFVLFRWLIWVFLGALAGYLLWCHRNRQERCAYEDNHYPWRER